MSGSCFLFLVAGLVLVHPVICLPDGLPQRVHAAHTAHADGQTDLRVALHPGLPHRFLDAVHHQRQPLRPQLRPEGLPLVMDRIQEAVRQARVESHPEIRLSISVGGVCGVHPLREAIRQADDRMYQNKARNKE